MTYDFEDPKFTHLHFEKYQLNYFILYTFRRLKHHKDDNRFGFRLLQPQPKRKGLYRIFGCGFGCIGLIKM